MTPLARAAAGVLDAAPPGPIGVAVSGGGDSVALLLVALDWAAAAGRRVEAVTIDHGLRADSADEAAAVARLCAARDVDHAVLPWRDWTGRGNLQDAAREARRALIGAWARERGIGGVALGHTLDDQAETFLMRLARGSGVDGLAGMAPVAWAGGLAWLRPLLGTRRAELRDWLTAQGVGWAEDPSNADPAFDRVRARVALPLLAGLGLGPERLAATALNMARARAALEAATQDLAARAVVEGAAGDLVLDPKPFSEAPEEISPAAARRSADLGLGRTVSPTPERVGARMRESRRRGHRPRDDVARLRSPPPRRDDRGSTRTGPRGAAGAAGAGKLGRPLGADRVARDSVRGT